MFAHAQSFDGVPVSGNLSTAIQKFKAKGYKLSKYIENGAIMKGVAGTRDFELYISVTPKSKLVYKFTLYFSEQYTWINLKSEYERYVDLLTEKHGTPTAQYDFFSSPYEDGDGFEMTAVAVEKATFSSYWLNKNNLNLAISISKWKQVCIEYENAENIAIRNKEIAKIENSIF
jgi:sRNA-binding regulator protein Hfq